jgi:hypothetical protein
MDGDEYENPSVMFEKNKQLKFYLWSVYIGCTFFAIVALCCGIYEVVFTARTGREDLENETFQQMFKTLDDSFNQWYEVSSLMASSLLAVVSTGLTVSYIILIFSLCTYFRE